MLIEPDDNGNVFCSALHFFLKWRTHPSLTEKKEIDNFREGGKFEITDEKLFEVQRAPLSYNQAPAHYQQNQRTKWLNHTSILYQAFQNWRKGSAVLDPTDTVDYDVPEQVNMTHPASRNAMFNIRSRLREERMYKGKRAESGLNLLMRSEQKNTSCMKNIKQRSTKYGNLA